ncbi:MAG: Rieske 2Fe-2S domain-containing protein [Devosia sp.]|nr:Rieske 2Fe-2S domain-containing protein [Devosia sp.]
MMNSRQPAWHPVASSEELPFRHVFHGQLLGQELAVWRADDGNVNVWENRCLHRGVRLSIGTNEGAELTCQYHGWRYANRSAGCTYIPAHPADAPARRIANRTYPVVERHGLIWSAVEAPPAFDDPLPRGDWLALRPLPVNATPEAVLTALMDAREQGSDVEVLPPLGATLVLAGSEGVRAAFFVQPVDSARAVIRGLIELPAADPVAMLRRFNRLLSALRDTVERAMEEAPKPDPITPVYEPVSVELATMPDITIGRQAMLRVTVAHKVEAADGIVELELAALSGHLPTFQPGAHIDVHLPGGLVRQYSITNGPGELLHYAIAVKREAASSGGSIALCDTIRVGDVLAISEPRNNFPLRRDATRTILIAGGIGITPLVSMAKALSRSGLPFEFHVFARSPAQLPYGETLAGWGDSVVTYFGYDAASTGEAIADVVTRYEFARHLYVCGPAPMLELTRQRASEAGWPEEAVHFEYFRNDREIDTSSSFTIELARSALTLGVPAGKSILEVLRENGIDAPSSCEQGACGTCLTTVLEGVPDHQDVYLNHSEKAANTCMMTCVSRALTPRLVLDI